MVYSLYTIICYVLLKFFPLLLNFIPFALILVAIFFLFFR